jgi:hypothetical protein
MLRKPALSASGASGTTKTVGAPLKQAFERHSEGGAATVTCVGVLGAPRAPHGQHLPPPVDCKCAERLAGRRRESHGSEIGARATFAWRFGNTGIALSEDERLAA